jgi:hypothetical protein
MVLCVSKNLAFGLYPSSSVFLNNALLPSSGKKGGGVTE